MTTWIDEQDQSKVDGALEQLRNKRAEYIQDVAGGDERFALWMTLADRFLMKKYEVTHFELSDWEWRSAYDAGESPASAAETAISEDDLFSMWDGGE